MADVDRLVPPVTFLLVLLFLPLMLKAVILEFKLLAFMAMAGMRPTTTSQFKFCQAYPGSHSQACTLAAPANRVVLPIGHAVQLPGPSSGLYFPASQGKQTRSVLDKLQPAGQEGSCCEEVLLATLVSFKEGEE